MKIVNLLIVAVIALLSIAAGFAKVMQAEPEMEFLLGLGLGPVLIFVFGLVQIVGGVLLVVPKTRMPGAILVGLAFVVSSALIFVSGDLAFGLISIIAVALAGLIIYQTAKNAHNKA